jgi:glycosyltransferase involved in cell wall biosynthesis
MKILVTLDFPPEPGGIQRYLLNIVKCSYSGSDRVLVGCAGADAYAPDALAPRVEYVTFFFSRINKKFSLIPLLFRCLRLRTGARESLLIECGNIYAALVPWLLSFFFSMEYRVYTHGTELLAGRDKGLRRALFRSVLARAHTIFVTSSYVKGLVETFGIHHGITRIPCKITLPSAAARQQFPRHAGSYDFRILCVARLVGHKGHRYLIDAVAGLDATIPWSLVLAGDGPEKAVLQQLCAAKKISNRVEFKSGLSDAMLEQEYLAADVFVLPSIETAEGTEGFGIVLLEAMAYRIPIIASDTGGIPEVLGNGACGMLVPARNAEGIADALTSLYNDRSRGAQLVEKAYERLVNNYVC